jgi:hypothetical protein
MNVIDKIYDTLEGFLPMEGSMAPLYRAAIGAGVGWVVMEAVRPQFAYNSVDGSKRPWVVLPELYEGRGAPTYLPFFVGPLAGMIALAGFV